MGWLPSEREVQAVRDDVSAFIGDTLVAVRYFTLDYARWEVAPIPGSDHLRMPVYWVLEDGVSPSFELREPGLANGEIQADML